MNVLFISPQPFFEERGTPIAVLEIIRALTSFGHRVDLYTYPIGKDVTLDGVRIIRSPKVPFIKKVKPGPSYGKALLDILLFLRIAFSLFGKRYDVIHAVEESAFFGVLLSKALGIPLIYDMDSSIPAQIAYTGFAKNSFILKFAGSMERWAIKNSAIIITVCSALTDIVKKGFPDKPVVQIEDLPLSCGNLVVSDETIARVKKDLAIDNNVVIVYTGNFEGYQGIDLLVGAIAHVVKEIDNVRFLLVGGEEKQVEEYREKVKDLGLRDKVVFTGKRPLEDMPLYMGIADILVSPRIEGTNTPLKIYTYLKSGKPVVATNLLTHTQVLNNDVAVLAEADPESFAKGIIKLVRDKKMREEFGRKGASYVDGITNQKRFYEKVADVYGYIERLRHEAQPGGMKK